MKKLLLLIIQGDPRVSHRPAEAIRMVAGLTAWGQAVVQVYLERQAICLLGYETSGLVKEDIIQRYLPVVMEQSGPLYVPGKRHWPQGDFETDWSYQELTTPALAAMAAKADYVMRF